MIGPTCRRRSRSHINNSGHGFGSSSAVCIDSPELARHAAKDDTCCIVLSNWLIHVSATLLIAGSQSQSRPFMDIDGDDYLMLLAGWTLPLVFDDAKRARLAVSDAPACLTPHPKSSAMLHLTSSLRPPTLRRDDYSFNPPRCTIFELTLCQTIQ